LAGESRRQRLRALLKRVALRGVDAAALEPAFVHPSAVHEGRATSSYERLEFVGDAILGLVVARWLYQRYPNASEGELSLRKASLCSDLALAETAERLEFGELVVSGGGLSLVRRRVSVFADALEAFIAALYFEAGFEKVAAFVVREHLTEREKRLTTLDDPKTILQEWSQRRYAVVPAYRELFEGPAHDRTFHAEVAVNEEILASGSGPSKKAAQRAAAAGALDVLRARDEDVAPRELSAPVTRVARTRKRTA
jgi:ribonuclease III